MWTTFIPEESSLLLQTSKFKSLQKDSEVMSQDLSLENVEEFKLGKEFT